MKRNFAFTLFVLLALTLAGCETIKGMGKDISTVGDWMTSGSENVQNPKADK
ncbi:entericidin [Candidatus Omnitrophota bacterium]